ncbi:MAG: helix-turn-helix domain-containing protein [Kyrpidia sp.]|nr:helix-turn-helix domain-containing protein [Kyrpidia sp.]
MEDWTAIRALRACAVSIKAIARQLGISRNTVRRALRGDDPPDMNEAVKPPSRRSTLFVSEGPKARPWSTVGTLIHVGWLPHVIPPSEVLPRTMCARISWHIGDTRIPSFREQAFRPNPPRIRLDRLSTTHRCEERSQGRSAGRTK